MSKSGIKNYLREQIAFLVMIAVLFGSFFNAFTISHEQISNLKNLEQQISLLGEKVLICTPDGYQWKTWKEIAAEKSSNSHDDIPKCKLCHASCSSGHAITVAAYSVDYKIALSSKVLPEYMVYTPRFVFNHSPPRSPPQFS